MSVEKDSSQVNDHSIESSLLDESFDHLVQKLLEEYHVPGLSVSIVDNDVISAKGYGTARFPSTPATADTLYYAGSTTKAFVAAAAGILINDPDKHQKLKWSSSINEFLKEDFELMDEHLTSSTTIEDALSHRTGFPRHERSYGWTGNSSCAMVKTMRHLPTVSMPRTKFLYCNLMYAAVADLLETLEGKDLEDILRERFWIPLGMNNTFFTLMKAADHSRLNPENGLSRGYYWIKDGKQSDDSDTSSGYYIPEPHMDLRGLVGAGAHITTVKDYALWVKAFLDAAIATESTPVSGPISRKLFEDVTTPRTIVLPPLLPPSKDLPNSYISSDLYGLGWVIYTSLIPGRTVVGHAGGLIGYGAQVFFMPDEQLGITTLGNTALTSNIVGDLLAIELMGKKVGLSKDERANLIAKRQVQSSMAHFSDGDEKDKPHKNAGVQQVLSSEAPLRGDLRSHAGSYSHPAYGTLDIIWASDNFIKDLNIVSPASPRKPQKEGPALFVTAKDHVWPFGLVLRHDSAEFFSLEELMSHGYLEIDPLESLESGYVDELSKGKKCWSVQPGGFVRGGAAFKYGPDDNVVKVGIRFEPEMDALVREEGDSWETGLIWFNKDD